MKKGIFTLALTVPGLALSTSPIKDYKIHVLQKGETLSGILHEANYKPLYGKDNWIDKVLELNHLSKTDAIKIKKGYPILIPYRPQKIVEAPKVIDVVKVKQAATLYHGLIGNRVSEHQDIFIDFAFFQMSGKVADFNVRQRSNFQLGFTYQDKNFRKYKTFELNPEFSFFGIGHGPTEFTNKSDTAASFGPTLQGQASVLLRHSSIDYAFGPYVELLERSSLDQINDDVEVRRDQFISVGAKARKVFTKDNLKVIVNGSIGTSVVSNNLNSYNNMQIVTSQFSTNVNLTKDYFIGGFWRNESFSGTDQENTNSFGFNLKYFVK